MVQRRRVRRASTIVLGLAFVSLGVWVLTEVAAGKAGAVELVGLILAAAALSVDLLAALRRPPTAEPSVGELADDLARILSEQWREEAIARKLGDSRILPLEWAETERPVRDSAGAVIGDPYRVVRLNLDGRLDGSLDQAIEQLAVRYDKVPSRRLVVLGEPGAGKTVLAILLTLGVLHGRAPAGAVPVLLSASSWDPRTEKMDEWIVRSLATSHYNGRADVPRRLLRYGLLLPIIDGLDEVQETSRRKAVEAINRTVSANRPVVVTCRAAEYEDLINGGAPVLYRAPVVEVRPVAADDLVTYLNGVDWPDGTRWDGVYEEIRQHRGAPVAQALSTPLMVSLAALVYSRLGGNPSELLDRQRYASRHAVEDAILDRVVEASYAVAHPSAGGPEPSAVVGADDRPPDVVRARQWLTFLAEHLDQHRERDLIWWRLSQRLLSPWTAPALGIAGGVLVMIAVAVWNTAADAESLAVGGVNVTIAIAAGAGTLFGVLAMVVWYAAAGRPPGRLFLARQGSLGRLRRGFRTGAAAVAIPGLPAAGAVATIITINGAWTVLNIERYLQGLVAAIVSTVVIGLALAVHSWLDAPSERAAHTSPLDSIRQDRRSSLGGALVAGIVAGSLLLPGVLGGAIAGSLMSKALTEWGGWPGLPNVAALARAHGSDLTTGLFGPPALLFGGGFLLPAICFTLLVLITRAWPRFLLMRLVTRVRGDLPWDLPGFLADARRRELLRQSAGAYQFRHIRLQERLANRTEGGADGPPVALPRRRMVRRAVVAAIAVALVVTVGTVEAVAPDNTARVTIDGAHGRGPYQVTPGPGGRMLALTSHNDSVVRVWDTASDRFVATLPGHDGGAKSAFFSANGRFLIVGSPGGWRVWDTAPRSPEVTVASYAQFLSDGRAVAIVHRRTGEDRGADRVELRNAVTGQPTAVYTGSMVDANSVSASGNAASYPDYRVVEDVGASVLVAPSKSRVVVGDSRGLLRLIDPATGQTVAAATGVKGGIRAARFDPDTTTLGVRGDDGLRLWDASSGRAVGVIGPLDAESEATFSPAGDRVAMTSGGARTSYTDDDTVRVWDRATAQLLATYTAPTAVQPPLFSPDGATIAVLSVTGGVLRLLATSTERTVAVIEEVSGFRFAEDANILMTQSRRRASSVTAYIIRVWDAGTGQLISELPANMSLGGLHLGPGARAAVVLQRIGQENEEIRVWDVTRGELMLELPSRVAGSYGEVRFSPDGRTLAVKVDNGVRLFDISGVGQEITTLRVRLRGGREDFERQVVFSPDGRTLTTIPAGDEPGRVWDVATGRLLRTLTGHAGPILSAQYSADSKTVITTGEIDDTVRLWAVPAP